MCIRDRDIDYIAASFIRRASDVLAIKELLSEHQGNRIKVIAKIENQEGLENKMCIRDRPASKIVQELIDNNALPRAIICANDNMAIATIDTLHKNDIFVPDDIIVTGFDGIRDTRYNIPPITTCCLLYTSRCV